MPEILQLDDELVERKRAEVDRKVNKRIYDLENKLHNVSYRNNGEINKVVDSYKDFMTVGEAFRETLSESEHLGKPSHERNTFLLMYSLYAGATEGLETLEYDRQPPQIFGGEINFEQGPVRVTRTLLEDYISAVENQNGVEETKDLTADYFKWIKEESSEKAKTNGFETYRRKANQVHVEALDHTFNGFETRSYDSPRAKTGVTLDDVVGNTEMKESLTRAVYNIMFYDIEEQVNIMDEDVGELPKTFYFYSEPGQGKSFTIEAILNHAQELAEYNDKPLDVKRLDNFKTKYYAESANKLREIFQEVNKGDKLNILVAEDIESIFHGRDDSDSSEDKSNLQTFMNELEGAFSQRKGNWFLIATTNYPINSDDALPSRLREKFVKVNGPETPSQYATLMQKKLEQPIEKGHVQVENWNDIGALCNELDFTGRDVKNVARTATDKVLSGWDIDGFDDYIKCDRETFQDLKNSFKTVDDEKLVDLIKQHQEELRRAEEYQIEKEVERRAEELEIRRRVEEQIGVET